MATKVTVRPNGQTLLVNASVSHWTTEALAVAASSANDVESTTTTTVSSDYDLWFANTATAATITVKQSDGTTIGTYPLNVSLGVGPYLLQPIPDVYQQAADVSPPIFNIGGLATGQATMDRAQTGTAVSTATGTMRLTSFISVKSESVTKVRFSTGGTAAAATPTLVRVGLYTVDSAGAGTLVASTANDTALAATINTSYEKSFSAPYTLTEGQLYTLGFLIVSAGQAPTLVGKNDICGGTETTEAIRAPRMCGSLGSQTDLPASYADGSLSASASVIYMVVSP